MKHLKKYSKAVFEPKTPTEEMRDADDQFTRITDLMDKLSIMLANFKPLLHYIDPVLLEGQLYIKIPDFEKKLDAFKEAVRVSRSSKEYEKFLDGFKRRREDLKSKARILYEKINTTSDSEEKLDLMNQYLLLHSELDELPEGGCNV